MKSIGISLVIFCIVASPFVSTVGKMEDQSADNVTVPQEITTGAIDSVWPMDKYNAQHTGRSPYNTNDNPGGERWKYFIDSALCLYTPVIDGNGTLYISSNFEGLYAIYPNGTKKWQRDLEGDIVYQVALGPDGAIYVGTHKRFHSFSSDGTLRWISPMEKSFISRPTISNDGIIYTGTTDGYLYAFYPNGTTKWEYYIGNSIISTSIDFYDNVFCSARWDKHLYCLNSNGSLMWTFITPEIVTDAPLIADDGTIYLVCISSIFALDPSGMEKWRISPNGDTVSPSLAPDGTLIYSTFHGPKIYGIDPTDGHIRWSYRVDFRVKRISSPVISNDGTIYFAYGDDYSEKGYLFALTPDGTLKWKTRLTTDYLPYDCIDVERNPIIGADGTVYVTSWFSRSGSNYTSIGYIHAIGGGKIQNIDEEYLTFFGKKLFKTPFRRTIVIGPLNLEMKFFHPEQLQKVEILIDGKIQSTLQDPPFEYSLDTRLLGRHTLEVKGYYNDGTTTVEKMEIFFLIL
jgi:outer membrane protein assembly factor BamB